MSNQIIIEPQKGWLGINLKELYEYRELIGFLALRDIMAQYKQAVFGVAWAAVRPIFSKAGHTHIQPRPRCGGLYYLYRFTFYTDDYIWLYASENNFSFPLVSCNGIGNHPWCGTFLFSPLCKIS